MHHRSSEYDVVYGRLADAARRRGRVFYAELAGLLAALVDDPDDAADVSELLRAVAHHEHREGRPLLSALAVTGKSIPGNVFFASARELGLLESNDPAEEMRFWLDQERRVYEAWQGER